VAVHPCNPARVLLRLDIMSMHHLANQCRALTLRMAELPLARMAPPDDVQARQCLTAVIERELERVHQIRTMLQKIADADTAEAPARLAVERGPKAENDRRYLLSSKRVLNQSIGKFLNARKMSEDGTITYVDLDSIDPSNPDEPNPSEDRPSAASPDNNGDSRDGEALSEPASAPGSHGGSPSRIVSEAPGRNHASPGNCDELKDGEAEIVGLARTENAARPASHSARPVAVSAKTPAPTLSAEASCDDDQILRIEAIEFVRGPWSVVRCEVETSVEPGVVRPAYSENAAHEPVPTSAAILRAGTSEAFREGEPHASRMPMLARTNPRRPLIDMREKRAPSGG
jgi:hypothetical protein